MDRQDLVSHSQRLGAPATFASVSPSGMPHMAPVVPEWIGPELVLSTTAGTVKARNARAHPHGALQWLGEGRRPDSLLIQGSLEVIEDDARRQELWDDPRFGYLPRIYSAPNDAALVFIALRPERAVLVRGRSVQRWRLGA